MGEVKKNILNQALLNPITVYSGGVPVAGFAADKLAEAVAKAGELAASANRPLIVLQSGAYTGDIVVPAYVDMIGDGDVSITGYLAVTELSTITNIRCTDALRVGVACTFAANDNITATAHGVQIGDVVTFALTAGGVTAHQTYYVKTAADANTITIAATRQGAAIDLSVASNVMFAPRRRDRVNIAKGSGTSRSSTYLNWDTEIDRPVPTVRYSSANQFFIVCDDARSTGWGAQWAELGNITALAYLQAKRIPVCWGVIPALVGTAGYQTAQAIGDNIQKCGGEALWHTYTHTAAHTGMPTGADADEYEVLEAIKYIETNIYPTSMSNWTYPCLSGVWAGVGGHATALDIARCDPYTKRGRLIRNNFVAFRDAVGTGYNDPRGEEINQCYGDRMPPRGRMPSTCITTPSQMFYGLASAADRATALTKWLNMMALSKGMCFGLWFHDIVSDATNPASAINMNVTVFKTLVDFLATEMESATPRIVPTTFSQAHWTYPCAAGEEPNLWPDPGFEYVLGGAPQDMAVANVNGNWGGWQQPKYFVYASGEDLSEITVSNGDAHDGSNSLLMYRKAGSACRVELGFAKVTPGEMLTLSWWQKNHTGSGALSAAVYLTNDASGAQVSSYNGSVNAGAGWEKKYCFITVPKNCNTLSVYLSMLVADTKLYVDDIFLG